MAICKVKCPNCGEISEVEANDFNVVCKFCGVPFMPKEGIDCYNNHISQLVNNLNVDTVNVNTENIDNYALLGIASLKEKNHEKCGFYADDILKRNPSSCDGLLLKAYFVSDNYSKEEGIRYYLLAYENAPENKKDLIISTFKENMLEYSSENFSFLFATLINKKAYFDLFKYALSIFFSLYSEKPLVYEETLKITTLIDYFKTDKTNLDNNLVLLDSLLVLLENEEVVNAIDLNIINKQVEKGLNKKQIKLYSYYFYINDHSIVNFDLENESKNLENYLNKHAYQLTTLKGGCYVATCVYGSYNTQEVWTLRRFRDFFLKKHILGRLFIKLYYSISPTLIRLFRNKKWFVSFNKKVLNSFVKYLNSRGYSSSPYRD